MRERTAWPSGLRGNGRRDASVLAGMLLAALLMIAVTAGRASAASEPFAVAFDESLSYVGHGNYGYPGFDGVNDMVPEEPAVRVRLTGEVDEGSISAGAEDLVFEPGALAIEPFVSYYEDDWRAVAPVTGTYDAGTGAMTLDVVLEQTITYEGARCTVGPVPVTLSTENESEAGSGQRFTEGLDGPGALAGSWADVPAPAGPDCDIRALGCVARQALMKGSGALGLARGGIELTGTVVPNADRTADKFGIVGYEDEGGCLGKRPDPGPGPGPGPGPEPAARLSLELERLSVGRKRAKFRVVVKNSGGAASGVEVCAKALRGPRLQAPRCRAVGALASGASVRRGLTLVLSTDPTKRRRQLTRGRLKVTVTAAGQAPTSATRRILAADPKP